MKGFKNFWLTRLYKSERYFFEVSSIGINELEKEIGSSKGLVTNYICKNVILLIESKEWRIYEKADSSKAVSQILENVLKIYPVPLE